MLACAGALPLLGCVEARTYTPLIAPAPSIPQLRIPQNNAYLGSIHSPRPDALRPRFTWTTSESEAEIPVVYRLELAIDRDFASDVLTFETEEISFQPPEALDVSTQPPVGRRYYWRVRGCVFGSCSEPSSVRWINLGRSDHDYNGDGFADVLVGAPNNDENGQDKGKAYVYFGESGDTFNTAPDGILAPTPADMYFATSVASAGDFDGDGYADVLVGAPASNAAGAAYLYFGGMGSAFDSTPDLKFTEISDGALGTSVSGAGDFNGDGFADLVIGAPGQLTSEVRGSAFLYFGNGERTKPTGLQLFSFSDQLHAGDLVALLGDLNNDGFSDITVSDTSISIVPATSCYSNLFLGRRDFQPGQRPDDTLKRMVSACEIAVRAAGDVNGDGFSDLLKASGDGTFEIAQVVLLLGSEMPRFPTGEIALASEVRSMAAAGDVNGDGFDDFVLGKDTPSVTLNFYSGSARIESPLRSSLSYSGPQGDFGRTLAGPGDVNGDGLEDLAVGNPGLNANRGAVSIYFGSVGAFDVNVDGTLDAGAADSSFGLSIATRTCPAPRRTERS